MDVSLLGPLVVSGPAGPVGIGSRKERSVMAALALSAGRLVPLDDLVDAVWGDAPPATAAKTLQGYVSRLRRVLPEGTFTTEGTSYRLDLGGGSTDVLSFEADIRDARRATESGESHEAIERFNEALGRWRGEPVPDLADSAMGQAASARLREVHCAAREDLAAELLKVGEAAQAVADLEALVISHPFREQAWEVLMLALYRGGRQADALRAFQRARDLLVDELGIEPGPALRRLEQQILDQDPALELAAPATAGLPAGPSLVAATPLPGTGIANGRGSPHVGGTASTPPVTRAAVVMFTDLVASTEYATVMGDAEAQRMRQRHFDAVAAVARDHRGTVVKSMGDGLMLVFEAASDAISAAVAMQLAVTGHGAVPAMRVGISVGDAYQEGDDWFGTTVNEAARVCSAATGGQILASDMVRLVARDLAAARLLPIEPLDLKGFDESVPACEVEWQTTTVTAWPPNLTVPTVELVGREEERRIGREIWDELIERGGQRTIFFGGEPGVGKTRLAIELALDAHRVGASVAFGRSDDTMTEHLGPWVGALTQLVGAGGSRQARRALDHDRLAVLARLLPGADLGPSTDAGPVTDRMMLFDTLHRLLAALAHTTPVVIVLDDLQWADEASFQFLRYVLRTGLPASSHLLILATYRPGEVDDHHPLELVIADARRDHSAQRLVLDGLTADETVRFVAAQAGRETSGELAAALHAKTAGNPFFVEELLLHLADAERASPRDDPWSTRDLDEIGLPASIREVVIRRVAKMAGPVRDALADAALVGETFDLDIVAGVRHEDEDDLAEHLDTAAAGRLIEEVPGTIGRYQFTHSLIRAAVVASWSGTRRSRRHRAILATIETLHPDDALAMSRHAIESATLDGGAAATRHGGRAVVLLREAGAVEQSVALAHRLLTVIDVGAVGAGPQADVLLELTRSEAVRGHYLEAADACHQVLAMARAGHDPDRFVAAVLELLATGDLLGVDVEVFAACEEALAMLGDADDARLAKIQARYAVILAMLDDPRSQQFTQSSRLIANRLHDAECAFEIAPFNLIATFGTARPSDRLDVADQALALQDTSSSMLWDRPALELMRALILLETGDRRTLEDMLPAVLGVADRHAIGTIGFLAKLAEMTLGLLDGDWAGSVRALDAALARVNQGNLTKEILERILAIEINTMRGEWQAASELSLANIPALGSMRIEPGHAWRSRRAGTATTIPIAAFDARRLPPAARSPIIKDWVELASITRDRELSAKLLPTLEPHAGSVLFGGYNWYPYGAADRYRGMLYDVLGDFDAAIRLHTAALDLERRLASAPLQSITRLHLAGALIRRGSAADRRLAERTIDDAMADAADLGMDWIIEDAERLRR